MIEDFITSMAERIVDRFAPLKIILFGSCARGDVGPDSDIDFLIVLPQVTDKRKMSVDIRRTLADFPIGKDIFVTTPDEIEARGNLVGDLLRPALREGKVIYDCGGSPQ